MNFLPNISYDDIDKGIEYLRELDTKPPTPIKLDIEVKRKVLS